jgi:hypothetical protein
MERTVRAIFQQHFESYARVHRVPVYVHRAAYWLSHCRSAALGGHVRRCPEGHVEATWYNSCHQRFCPQCQALETERWLEQQRARLLACAHHHLIFTIPHELNALWCYNRAALGNVLFGAVRDVLTELLADARYAGGRGAFLLGLHTWSRTLALHPHIHALVADGALTEAGAWVAPRRSHFLPARVVMVLFRGKFLDRVRGAMKRARLRLPADTSRERLHSLLNRLGRKKWNVHLMNRYAHGEGVAAYLARYLRGGPIKNAQLLEVTGQRIRLRGKGEAETGAGASLPDLTPHAFLQRYLAHLPVPGQQRLRAYGLYAHTQRARLDGARAQLGQAPVSGPEPIDYEDFLARFKNSVSPTRCPRCRRILQILPLAPDATGPPRVH